MTFPAGTSRTPSAASISRLSPTAALIPHERKGAGPDD